MAPTSTEQRIRLVVEKSGGFIYLVSLMGVTGARRHLPPGLEAFVRRVRSFTGKPLCVGFGISGPEQARRAGQVAGPVQMVPEWVGEDALLGVDHSHKVPVLRGWRSGEALPDWREESAQSWPIPSEVLAEKLARPCQGRLYYIRYAFKQGWSVEQVYSLTSIDPWFLENIKERANSILIRLLDPP